MSERVEDGGPVVTVKPLEWGPYPNPVFNDPENVAVALVGFKHLYQVQRDPWGPGYIAYLAPEFGTLWWESKGHLSLDAAKVAAQADYESRILAALHTSPSEPLNARTQGVEVSHG